MDLKVFIIVNLSLIGQGLIFWYCADLPLIFREIAINTRNGKTGSDYKTMDRLSAVISFAGVICWIICLLHIIFAIKNRGYLIL